VKIKLTLTELKMLENIVADAPAFDPEAEETRNKLVEKLAAMIHLESGCQHWACKLDGHYFKGGVQ
jgi:hypothetical protein